MSWTGLEVAVIGLSCKVPGAADAAELWRNLCAGVESITVFSEEELLQAGVDPALVANPAYVRARGVLEGADLFDAAFFDMTPREAEVLDPQQRLFLECSWAALESAGYDPHRYKGWVGVYAGTGMGSYFIRNIWTRPELIEAVGPFQVTLAQDKDFLATRVSYKLNLRGPSLTVQTACSTSLVAVHLACQALLRGECDMALAGGVSIGIPQESGYVFQEGGILSPDGHCRPFDARARGCVGGSGVGVVLLKRLDEALEDGDVIRAVIRGSAINNDGAAKVGFTAPQVDGQAAVIAAAQAIAEVEPESITYIEAHGTATELGDPIEVAALTQAFRKGSDKVGFCALGSLKSNMGHLDAAAGVAGLIKTVLALENRQIPPSLHFESPNPQIDFAGSPFFVNSLLTDWQGTEGPRRAGVSSFGIGGTNAHAILEEAPVPSPSGPSRPWQLLPLSARTPAALDRATESLAAFLEAHPDLCLADVARTLQVGRTELAERRALVCCDLADAAAALRDPRRHVGGTVGGARRQVAFLFPGQGAQSAGMGAEHYRHEPVFRRVIDECAEVLSPLCGWDLRLLVDPPKARRDEAERMLGRTEVAQPALFAVEYALARLWMSWGLRPQAMLGHSIGEYVAACLAEVFSLEDGLRLMAARGALMQRGPTGAMLAVHLPESEVTPLLRGGIALAAVNGPELCVVAGAEEGVDDLRRELHARRIGSRPLPVSHPFHSPALAPLTGELRKELEAVSLRPPRLPYLSNLTGTWIRDREVTDPEYWCRHMMETVRFEPGIRELAARSGWCLLDVGPGQTLMRLALRHPDRAADLVVAASFPAASDGTSVYARTLEALGQLWTAGVPVAADQILAGERRRRVALPTYPFDRQRYWVEPRSEPTGAEVRPERSAVARIPDMGDWFWIPTWTQAPPAAVLAIGRESATPRSWLIFADRCGLCVGLAKRLRRRGETVSLVEAGEGFQRLGNGFYRAAPGRREDVAAVLRDLETRGELPDRIVHARQVTGGGVEPAGADPFFDLAALAQGLGDAVVAPSLAVGRPISVHVAVLSDRLHRVMGDEPVAPRKATLLGPVRVIPQEYPGVTCAGLDVVLPAQGGWDLLIEQLLLEMAEPGPEPVVAYRGGSRWVQEVRPLRLAGDRPTRLRQGGVYLITGGLGGVGLALAEHLVLTLGARLVLTGRSGLSGAEGDRVRKIRNLEALGAEVLVLAADAGDPRAMETALEKAVERFGALHGIFHAAGLAGGGVLQLLTPEAALPVMVPKVEGALTLLRALDRPELDFILFFSSQRALVGGLGRAEYCAANAFLDALAQARSEGVSSRVMAVDWDSWREVGMAAEEAKRRGGPEDELLAIALSPSEGCEVVRRVLATRLTQVVVSTSDFPSRVTRERQATAGAALEGGPKAPSREARGHARPHLSTPYEPPRNQREEVLARVWSELLGVEPVGVHDHFFELGGDSVVALQMVARAGRAGLSLTARQVFEHPTIADLVASLGEEPVVVAEQGPAVGEAPLTPIQGWFLERDPVDPHHFNQAALLEVHGDLTPARLYEVTARLFVRHDALRFRYERAESGWRQWHADPGEAPPFTAIDLSTLPEAAQSPAVAAVASALQSSLDLGRGPIARVVFCRLSRRPNRLIVVVHHLAIDVISWRILLEDLESLCDSPAAALPPKTTSFQAWAERLRTFAGSPEMQAELDLWLASTWERAVPLPIDRDAGANTLASAATVTVVLDEESTAMLVRDVPRVYLAEARDLLLTALAETLAHWSGGTAVAVDLEGHGREPLFDDVDLSRTVGWFTSLYPVLLDLGRGTGPDDRLRRIKEALRAIPRNGIGFGLLRFLSDQPSADCLRGMPPAGVVFLYTGQVDDAGRMTGRMFRPAPEPAGENQSPRNPRSHLLEVAGRIEAGRLEVSWTYSRNRHSPDVIARLAESYLTNLRSLIAHCLSSSSAVYTPADFPDADLDQEELDELLKELG